MTARLVEAIFYLCRLKIQCMLKLSQQERRTFFLHASYATIDGSVLGILALNEFVFLKSIHGSNYQMSLLFQFSMAVFILLFFFHAWLKKVHNRKKLLRIAAVITRLPLIAIVFFPRFAEPYDASNLFQWLFLIAFLVYFMGALVINPTINLMLKTNYEHKHFGKLYSYATSLNKIVMMVVTFGYGWLLDLDYYAFTYALPAAGFMSIAGLWLLSMISFKQEKVLQSASVWQSVRHSAHDMWHILRTNKPYLHFEWGFMFYGFSFMVSVTVIAIYFYEGLDLNYSSVAFYRNAYNVLAIILLPFFGSLMGNIDPRKFSVITYSSIMLYIAFLLLTVWFPSSVTIGNVKLYYLLIFYIIAHGVFAATMVLLWNIGSAYFCAPSEAGSYQSVHLFLTGFRALFAPTLGVLFYESFGVVITFLIAMASLAIAITINLWSYFTLKASKML